MPRNTAKHSSLPQTNLPLSSLESSFFDSLDELANWERRIHEKSFELDELNKPTEKLAHYTRARQQSTSEDVKLLVCHDLKGGYQVNEDEDPLGYFPHPDGQHYFLQYPQLVDKFVYFSHHRVSIPPVSWINVCHRNAIKCLGTVIFEGNTYRDFEEADKLLTKQDGEYVFVRCLVALVEYFQFDGYLFNIETRFSNTRIASLLEPFLEQLRAELHVRNPSTELIWYDSYIYPENRVLYKNGVTEANYNFFSCCDSFFTNYWWNVKHLQDNIKNVGVLGSRLKVYAGYDVWGRGTMIGKGGYDSALACQMIKKYRSNVALFAPAWTYEYLARKDFTQNDTRFWIGLFDGESSMATTFKPYSSPLYKINDSNFVFYTNFGSGEGCAFYECGEKVYRDNWVNGSLQMEIPYAIHTRNKNGIQWTLSKEDSFHGGSCVEIKYNEVVDDKGYQVFNNQTINSFSLFSFVQDCSFPTVNVKLTYKLNHKTKSFFKLKIGYYIERRYRTVQKVRSGCLVVPLLSTNDQWFTIEEPFHVSLQNSHEFIVLDSATIFYEETEDPFMRAHVVEDQSTSSVIDNEEYEKLMNSEIYFDDEDEDWILVPSDISMESTDNGGRENHTWKVISNQIRKKHPKSHPSTSPVLKLGELAIINANDYPSDSFFKLMPVNSIDVRRWEGKILLIWKTNQDSVLYHLIFVDDVFQGISLVSKFVFEDQAVDEKSFKTKSGGSTKVRIDTVNRLGILVKGTDMHI
ncbi:hypothetical protein KL918_001645 [Ogataea parapolymorpha]|uniref:Endo-beta-N-acetylglucosaminidase n=1 Tax=Ogataea parapolymorpha (strain ATCC 26012 / BCRC 20466 / JCM 22074 / NRRL Y-7560 / DL-1) TaxID=871575 RepID=W1QD87_OGAPD|nr:endo-beta-N-acetylglucosaminidase [Ogataea parapolymorpha DL-1]ESW99424.1 endo-beta-N-acetylglucosaminidase [Ogataea parapolymorpha DL-1]KAG7869002.1 hypothetical protein KL918_001645 [Ogataea parapolymorpha]KAG7874083.1 hypothetical protein KL916_001857 [Ogataea parapolymorpha]